MRQIGRKRKLLLEWRVGAVRLLSYPAGMSFITHHRDESAHNEGYSVRLVRSIFGGFLLLVALGCLCYAGDDLKIVLLDSKDAHPLRGKLVCLKYPVANPNAAVVEHPRDCRRTDSGGTATFALPDPAPENVDVFFSSDGLIPCFSPHTVTLADAMDKGAVMSNTCGDASTDTTQTGELVLFAHQKSLKEAMDSVRNEF